MRSRVAIHAQVTRAKIVGEQDQDCSKSKCTKPAATKHGVRERVLSTKMEPTQLVYDVLFGLLAACKLALAATTGRLKA